MLLVLVPLFLPLAFKLQKATPWQMQTGSPILTFERPYEMQAVGFGIKLRFVQDCFELAKAMDEEQKEMLRALEADRLSRRRNLYDMFGQHELDYIEKCVEIAVEVIATYRTCYNLLMARVGLQYLTYK
ncbi:hypothetical protein EDC04DRAFT_2614216 [Pisolithus marmoratus]|nr:hypothetical protein EDC04DRAFT_2614216 [Pisolithus marmoratus]